MPGGAFDEIVATPAVAAGIDLPRFALMGRDEPEGPAMGVGRAGGAELGVRVGADPRHVFHEQVGLLEDLMIDTLQDEATRARSRFDQDEECIVDMTAAVRCRRQDLAAEREFGAQSVWLNYYAGTMGRVMRDGVNRLANAKKYSRHNGTICVNLAWPGFIAGTGKLAGPDPREMAKSDCVVIWGTNAVATQVNVMTHAMRARKERGAKIVSINPIRTGYSAIADEWIPIKPGTDGALLMALLHELIRTDTLDHAFLKRFTLPYKLTQIKNARALISLTYLTHWV